MNTESRATTKFRRIHGRVASGIAALAIGGALLLAGTGGAVAHGPGQGPGFGMGPGQGQGMMMAPWGRRDFGGCPGAPMGPGQGQGMMGPGMMMGPWGGQGFGMGPGMMTGPMMGPRGGQDFGMMGPGMMMGPRADQGMMAPRGGQGMMGPKSRLPGRDLTIEDVRARLENWLAHMGNPRLEVGEIKEVDEDSFVADIVTKEGKALVDRFRIDRHTGAMERVG